MGPAIVRHGRGCARGVVVVVVLLIPLVCNLLSQQAGGSSRPGHRASRVHAFASWRQICRQRDPITISSHLSSGPHGSQHILRSSVQMSATPAEIDAIKVAPDEMQQAIKIARSLRASWKLKEAVEVLGIVISSFPDDMLSNANDAVGPGLKYAMMLRADWNLLMGNNNQCIEDLRNILVHWPSDRDARIQLAHALNDGKLDTEQALTVLGEVLDEGPEGAAGDIADISSYTWAAQDAGVFAASLGKHDMAQQYFEMFRKHLCEFKPKRYKYVQICMKSSEQMKRYSQGVFYEMVNAIIIGDAERAAAAAEFHKSMRLNEHPELVWFRQVFTSSWEFILSTSVGKAPEPSLFYGTLTMLKLAMDAASLDGGLILELGVWHGSSLRMTASDWPDQQVHGFDTFTGLPEAWGSPEKGGESVGAYSTFGATPSDLPQNVQLHAGLFSDTLPGFLETHPGPIRFMNVDCDLYSSTKDIFDQVSDRIVPGTVLVFDEYLMTPTWQDDEFKAFQEAVTKNGWTFEYVAISIMSGQAIIRIT
ncbi:unnamed protein product [Polarella glacialis]|uniref:Uncharacterized protein n=1 Tax=Polarella glacialis TaxID=89957 RepID=A0A813E8E2_POLGL|nr:unnamed protein product [Polarella glacialis]